MDDSQRKIERGLQASFLLENTLFQDCLDKLESTYIEAWKACPTVEGREDAHRYVRLIGVFRKDIESLATTGVLTQQRIDELQRKPRKLAEFNR